MKPATATFDPAYFRAQGWWRDETLRDWLARPAKAVHIERRLRTTDRADHVRTASAIASVPLPPGSQMRASGAATWSSSTCRTCPEFLVTWLAINALGAVMQTVHTPYGIRELEHLIAHGGAKAASRWPGQGSFAGGRHRLAARQASGVAARHRCRRRGARRERFDSR